MTPPGRPHARVVQRLTRLLVRAVGDDLEVLTQLPLTLLDDSEPDPAAGAYRARTIVPSGESLTPAALPGVRIDVAGLFH